MANPVATSIVKGAWRLVATNVTSGIIHKLDVSPSRYLQTYRLTGEAAPTDINEGAILFENGSSESIESSDPIDVYVWAKDADGSVRVDV